MKWKYLLIFGFLFLLKVAGAQSVNTEAYIRQYKDLAITEMKRTGVPAAIKLAQAILESQSGASALALTANNHFGIKCKTEWIGGKVYQDDDERGECFRVYPSVEESYMDHSDFLKNRPYYASLFKLEPTDMQGWAFGLKKAGYATNPSYPQKLLKIISDYNLEQYNTEITSKSDGPVNQINPVRNGSEKEAIIKREVSEIIYSSNSLFPKGIFTINRSKVIFAIAGTNLASIARQFDISIENILDFNELSGTGPLTESRLIYLERKLKRGARTYRIAQTGETLRDISQWEGIRLEQLLLYNQAVNPDNSVLAGQKIWLQPVNEINSNLTENHRL